MKPSTRPLLWLVLAALFPTLAHAVPYSFEFKAERKKLEGKRTVGEDTQVSHEKWCYDVTIDNHSFKDISDIEIKYIIYFKTEGQGSKVTKERHKNGSTTAAVLQNNGTFEFQTDSVELTKSQLDGGFYYANGAKPRSRDSITGIWLRLYQGGTMIGEYADPQSLTSGDWDAK